VHLSQTRSSPQKEYKQKMPKRWIQYIAALMLLESSAVAAMSCTCVGAKLSTEAVYGELINPSSFMEIDYAGATVYLRDSTGSNLPNALMQGMTVRLVTTEEGGATVVTDCSVVPSGTELVVINCNGLHTSVGNAFLEVILSPLADSTGGCLPGSAPYMLHLSGLKLKRNGVELITGAESNTILQGYDTHTTATWDLQSVYDLGDIVQNRDSNTDPILTLPAPSGTSGTQSGTWGNVQFKNSIDGHDYYGVLGLIPDGSSISVRISKAGTSTPGSFSETRTFTLNCP
jgi:hypothetical protein